MGITGLLPLLAPISRKGTLSDFKGKKAAVDGFVWLHRGCISCAKEVCKKIPTNKYIRFFMKRVQLLIDQGIKPLIVFDGSELPAKVGTNERRRQNRQENLIKAEELNKRGLEAEANSHYKLAIDISPEILQPLFSVLRKRHIDFIVAPYEADAQLSYLCRHKFVDFVITEDSDMIPYECPVTVFKLDNDGNCESIQYQDIFNISIFKNFSRQMLLEACVLSGCDYLQSAPKIGIRTALKLIQTHGTGKIAIQQAMRSGKVEFPPDYFTHYQEALRVFREQKVYDPSKRKTVSCFEEGSCELAGEDFDSDFAQNFADGLINPRTKQPFNDADIPEKEEVVVSVPTFVIPASESAKKQFKPHFGSTEFIEKKVTHRVQIQTQPRYVGKRSQTPPAFTLPSRRLMRK